MDFLRVYISFLLLVHLAESAFLPCLPDEICTRLSECSPLLPFLKPQHMTSAEMEIFSPRQCGYDPNSVELVYRVFVCCPAWDYVLPNRRICGQTPAADRVTSGKEAGLNEMPWMAMLLYAELYMPAWRGGLVSMCAGSLITNRYVLTAGHCLERSGYELRRVRLGEHDTTSNPDCTEVNGRRKCAAAYLEMDVQLAIRHKDYMVIDHRPYNDIGLLRLRFPVRYTDAIKPICIQLGSYEFSNPSFDNYTLQVAGWGLTLWEGYSNVLLRAHVTGRKPDKCPPSLGLNEDTQICAGGLGGRDTCKGDSGSPLMAAMGRADEEFVYLAGITSYGYNECGSGPAAYTKTSKFLQWIQWNMWKQHTLIY
ncbi:spaetzle-processing enzyme [Drosophila teissieri]|uniref:spaetzle-processing enzyme n=1 Tax=Drosophila teissieri TaxID=7243 RepID=UPI001CBA3177|nr:spaetzle-processing enzyme [Drosophila teissieri]